MRNHFVKDVTVMKRLTPIFLLLATSVPALAIEPAGVFLLVNKNMPASQEVAEHYCAKRGVPKENIVSLDLPTGEDISRQDFDEKLAVPLREALKEKKEQAKVLLAVYGVPLRVGSPAMSKEEKGEVAKLDAELAAAKTEIERLEKLVPIAEMEYKEKNTDETKEALAARKQELDAAKNKQRPLQGKREQLVRGGRFDSRAGVDSELMLLWWDKYELRGWVNNPLYWQIPENLRATAPKMLLTCRLDGPTPEIAKRLVDDAMEAEKEGLQGKVYVDARGIGYDPKEDPGFGYGGYDQSMRDMAALLKDDAKLEVVLDDKGELFAKEACPDCSLYCGWYSHANFIDSCRFKTGAVAWHLASSEAVSLRQEGSKLWCKNLLEKGACATLGPVAEPFTIGFPKPAEFFGSLATGKYTLVESYGRTVMLTSWMGTLIGDPLYNPFGKKPALAEEKIFASPKGGQFFMRGR
ncbi:MAG: TIGR03790 family protein [Planctomycetales bacterium]|nr:TIGR03790 family protein [Planctomycetales bacterium]